MTEMLNYFNELREQIMNEEKWDENRFVVFDHEPSTGKSQNTFSYVAEMTKEKPHRVLYVQKFIRDDQLPNTVETINDRAGKRVAEGIHSKMGKKAIKEAIDAQILVISHQMYLSICKGNRPELVEGRDILIIDEHPDLVERITLSQSDIGAIWLVSYRNDQLEDLAYLLRKKLYECKKKWKQNMMQYIDFSEKEFELFKNMFSGENDKVKQILGQPLYEKLQQILTNGCLYYEDAFYTFNNQIKFHLLNNNILLDGNAGFDYRYRLSSKFIVKKQRKFYDYSSSTLQHFSVKTDKTSLNKQINLEEKVFERIYLETKEKTLIVTDKENSSEVRKNANEYLSAVGFNFEQIEEATQIDHFGNLIGVNTYRYYNTVIILKTPFYDYLSYALTYFYFQSMEHGEMIDIEVFKNEVVENIKKTVVAGEIYQALKRINRDNSQSAHMVVCTDYQDAMDIVVSQFQNIQYKNDALEVNEVKEKELPKNSSKARIAKAKEFLLKQMEAGVKEVSKNTVREWVGVSDRGNFTRTILNKLVPFFEEYGIEMDKNSKSIILNR